MRMFRAWDSLFGLMGFLRRNRRQRKAALAKRRNMRRQHRFDALEQRVVLNADPVAEDDQFYADVGAQITIAEQDMLANDDGGETPISIHEFDTQSELGGSVSYDAGIGEFTYSAPGTSGTDRFSYTITDGEEGYATAYVYITLSENEEGGGEEGGGGAEEGGGEEDPPSNHAPYSPDLNYVTDQDTTLEVDAATGLLPPATDDDGDDYYAEAGSWSSYYGGSVDVETDGSFTYTPPSGFAGQDWFEFQLTDGMDSSQVTVYIEVAPYDDGEDGEDEDGGEEEGGGDEEGDGEQNYAPEVGATEYWKNVSIGESYTFSASDLETWFGAWDPDYDLLNVTVGSGWFNFGELVDNYDGTYTYNAWSSAGQDYIDVTFDDNNGGSVSATLTFNVQEEEEENENDAPEVGATEYWKNVSTGESFTFSADDLNNWFGPWDPNGDSLAVTVGTGSFSYGEIIDNGDGTYTYNAWSSAGQDYIDVTFDDGNGGSVGATLTFDVQEEEENESDAPDVGSGDYAKSVWIGESYTFDVDDLIAWFDASDPNGDSLNVTVVTGTFSYGELVDNGDGTYTYYAWSSAGEDYIDVTFEDGNGGSVGATLTFNVQEEEEEEEDENENRAPEVGSWDYWKSVSTGESYTFDASDLETWFGAWDPDYDTLTILVGSGSFNCGELVDNGDGTYTYNAWSSEGQDYIDVTFDDGNGGSVGVTLVFDVAAASSSPVTTYETYRIHVKRGHQIEVSPGNLISWLGAYDDDGDTLEAWFESTSGQYGNIADEDGTLYYFAGQTPGVDSFTVTFSDEDGNPVSATLEIEVRANRAPTIGNDENTIELDLNQEWNFHPSTILNLLGISDPDGDGLEVSLTLSPGGGTLASEEDGAFTYTPSSAYLHSFSVVAYDDDGVQVTGKLYLNVTENNAPTALPTYQDSIGPNGTSTFSRFDFLNWVNAFDPDGDELQLSFEPLQAGSTSLLFDGENGEFQAGGSEEQVSYRYTITDELGATFEGTWTIDVVFPPNEPPVAEDDSFEIDEDDPGLNIAINALLANDHDPNGNGIEFVEALEPQHGELTYDSSTNGFTYTPDADFSGVDSFEYRIRDDEGAVSSGWVHITVVGVPDEVVANDDSFDEIDEDGMLIGNVQANDHSVDGVRPVTLVAGPEHGTLELNEDGSFTYAPDADFFGQDSFVYEITSGDYTSQATATIAVRPVNDAPSFTPGANVEVAWNSGDYSAAWAADIGVGPQESDQEATWSISVDRPELFAELPTLAADGTLTFRPAPGAHGVAVVTVVLVDDGGTDDGGVDASQPITFEIAIQRRIFVDVADAEASEAARSLTFTVTLSEPSDEVTTVVSLPVIPIT